MILALTDDADGTVVFTTKAEGWPIQDLRLEIAQEQGRGSTLHVRCDVTKLADYLVLRVSSTEDDGLVSVPSMAVLHIEQRDLSALAVSGTRLIDRLAGGTHPLVDLGELLFDSPVDPDGATYVHVRYEVGDTRVIALRVRAVLGITRGSKKPVPVTLRAAPVRGFLSSGQEVVAVIDLARALSLTNITAVQAAEEHDAVVAA